MPVSLVGGSGGGAVTHGRRGGVTVADLVLAVDIGGTKMASGLVGLDGSLVERAVVPTAARAGGARQ